MKEKSIRIKVSYPVPSSVLVLNADEIRDTGTFYELYKENNIITCLRKSNFGSDLIKTSENIFQEFYEIHIN